MAFDSLIDADQLFQNINKPNWVIIDCHFELDDPEAGRRAYLNSHIPGAIYAHLEEDLSGKVIKGKSGRHPLPEIGPFVQLLSAWGIDQDVQVVVYDNRGGGIAARLWWMLKWLGHDQVAMLDGGLGSWTRHGFPLDTAIPKPQPRVFQPSIRPEMMVNLGFLFETERENYLIIDSRAPDRYSGENEPIDPIPGHIPDAQNAFYQDNLDPEQRFLSKEKLAERFSLLLSGRPPGEAVFYCGSGVTAAHNILAMYTAGLGLGKLYPGSYSEWITDPKRPVEGFNKLPNH